jgi:hypothetical protein
MIVLKSPQEKFLGALQAVAGIVERRHTLPVLANVLLRKNGGEVEFTTSDLEIQVRTRAEFDGDAGSFSTTVGARKLIDILRTLPPDQVVSVSASQNKLTLQGGKSRFTLQTLPSDDFPLVIHRTGRDCQVVGVSSAANAAVRSQGSSGPKALWDQAKIAFSTESVALYQNYQRDMRKT